MNKYSTLYLGIAMLTFLWICAGCARQQRDDSHSLSEADIPRLINDLRSQGSLKRFKTAQAFKSLGSAGCTALIEAIGHSDPKIRDGAVMALGELQEDALPAVPYLIDIIESDREVIDLKVQAARSIGMIGPAAKDAVPALIQFIQQDKLNAKHRRWAISWGITALGHIGAEAKAAIPVLEEISENKRMHEVNRSGAEQSLRMIKADMAASAKSVMEHDK